MLYASEHPLVRLKVAELRDAQTRPPRFRELVREISMLLGYEALRSLPLAPKTVRTPLADAEGYDLAVSVGLVPILRAGLGMLASILQLIPHARVGFVGLKRHEHTLKASVYHKSLPADLSSFEIILIDPMLATGGSAVAALKLLGERGARRVRLVSLVAAPEGIAHVQERYPELPIFTAAIDEKLNGQGYIVPGLGDAGDRLFGV